MLQQRNGKCSNGFGTKLKTCCGGRKKKSSNGVEFFLSFLLQILCIFCERFGSSFLPKCVDRFPLALCFLLCCVRTSSCTQEELGCCRNCSLLVSFLHFQFCCILGCSILLPLLGCIFVCPDGCLSCSESCKNKFGSAIMLIDIRILPPPRSPYFLPI